VYNDGGSLDILKPKAEPADTPTAEAPADSPTPPDAPPVDGPAASNGLAHEPVAEPEESAPAVSSGL